LTNGEYYVRFSYIGERISDMDIHELRTVSDVEALLLKLVKKGCVQDSSFVPTAKTIPLKEIKGFDSLTALEVLTELEEETGIHVEEDIFYVDLTPKQYLPIHAVAAAIWEKIHGRGKKNG
jgi:acyl carrier protein